MKKCSRKEENEEKKKTRLETMILAKITWKKIEEIISSAFNSSSNDEIQSDTFEI